nr:TPA_asm: L [Fagopyrum alphacytorhabdovirus 1]
MDYLSILEDSSEGHKITKKDPLPDFHLRNPIQPLLWYFDVSKRTTRTKSDCVHIEKLKLARKFRIGEPFELHQIGLKDGYPSAGSITYELIRESVICRLIMDHEIFPGLVCDNVNNIRDAINSVECYLWDGMRFWNKILTTMNALSSGRTPPPEAQVLDGKSLIKWSAERTVVVLKTCICVIKSDDSSVSLYDGDWVRMTSDILTQRFLVSLGCKTGRLSNPHQYPLYSCISQVLDWGDNVIREHGNNGYKLLKAFEALVIGELQARGQGQIIRPDRFLTNTANDLFDAEPGFHLHIKSLLHILHEMSNPHHITQVYGLHRIWGHPMVFSKEGMEKVIKIGRKNIMQDNSLTKNAGRMFKVLLTREYRRRHGVYPQIFEVPTGLCTALREGGQDATSLSRYTLEEWDRIKFKQTFQLPETFNLSMIVADKSISPTHSELINIIKKRKTVMDPDKRRGVKRWLEDKTLNPRQFLAEVNEGQFPDDHKIIGLTPKERELNPVPRMFALMSHLLRVYVVLTEQLVSDHILKYFPQITMTDTLLELTKKTYSTVKSQSSLNKRKGGDKTWASRVVCLSLDFEKWNGHMRKEMTLGVFTAMGELFGLSEIFNCTYDIFSECYYYLADGTYLPNISGGILQVEEPLSFRGHKGGMEGLRQKGWTVFTVCGLEVILSRHNCTYKIMGMGDNQVLQVTLYTNKVDEAGNPTDEGLHDMKNELDSIFHDLVTSFTSAGLPLKPLETWMSEDLFLYGKVPVWRGVPLAMDLKKIMRMFPFSNAEVMTLENALSTISGNALSATQSTVSAGVPYSVALFMSSLCIYDFLNYHPLLGLGISKAVEGSKGWTLTMGKQGKFEYVNTEGIPMGMDQLILLISLIPRTLMGYNGINPLEMTMRGFPDNLSRDVSYLFSLCKCSSIRPWLKRVVENWLSPIYMPNINYAALLQDVTAVNLLSPRSPSSGIKQVVTQYMTSGVHIRNQEFKDLMTTKHKTHEEFMSELLCSGDELHIRLLHDIMEASIYGYVDSILSKVVKTTTIQRLAMRASDRDVFDVIEADEKVYASFFVWRCSVKGDTVNLRCSTSHCKRMRLEGWQKNLRGITIPHPHSYMRVTDCSHSSGCTCEDGYMSISFPDAQLKDDLWFNEIGGCPPYLGSMTKEKVVVGAGGKVYSSEPLIKRPLNLLRIINWFVPPDSNTAQAIKALVSSVTDLDPEPHVGLREGAAGAEVHRYKDSSTTHGALTSCSYLLSTRYHISSDHFHRYCRGTENTDLHFQALYCYLLEMTNFQLLSCVRLSKVMPRFTHFKQCCYDCICPVKDDFVDIPSQRVIRSIPSRKGNPYLFVEKDKIRILEERSPLAHLSETEFTANMYDGMSESRKRLWLQEILAYKIAGSIVGEGGYDDEDEDKVLNIASFERTMYLKMDPKNIIELVMSIIAVSAEWKWLEFTGHQKKASRPEIVRIMLTIIKKASLGSFLGLGMFFCWKETTDAIMSVYAEMVVPTSNPISTSSACSAIKDSLISLCYKQVWPLRVRAFPLAYDERSNLFVIKNILYQNLLDRSGCLDCKRLIKSITDEGVRKLGRVSCMSKHKPFEKMTNYPWQQSNVTMERLRKDCDTFRIITVTELDKPPVLNHSYVIKLLVDRQLLGRPDMHYEINTETMSSFPMDYYQPNGFGLSVLDPLPTRTRSKYIPLFSTHRKHLTGKQIFVTGDGLGTTSQVLSTYQPSRIICSTLLDPDLAIPQTYVHNSPSAWAGINIPDWVNHSIMITKPNNILDERWHDAWSGTVADLDVVVCDAEMIGKDIGESRARGLESILSLKEWSFVMYKTYLYTCEDLCRLIQVLLSARAHHWEIVTTPFRSFHYPEVWIIMKHTCRLNRAEMSLTYGYNQLRPHWNSILSKLIEQPSRTGLLRSVIEDIYSMASTRTIRQMTSRTRAWLTLPTVGFVYPDRLGFMTKVYYYLGKSQLPAHVRYQRGKSHLKLYDTDYYRLRDVLLCVALSMTSSTEQVARELKESSYWYLHWEERSYDKGHWDCVLAKSHQSEGKRADIDDYIPIARMMYKNLGLGQYPLGYEVRFAPKSKYQAQVQFTVSKRALMPLKSLYIDKRSA